MLKDKYKMLTPILIGLFAGISGTTGVWLYIERKKPVAEPVNVEAVIESVMQQHKPSEQLTEPDLLAVPCSIDYINKNGQSLCREMFCRMTTRGIDTKTSGAECERISNLINKAQVIEICKAQDNYDACIDLFDKRL